MQSDSNRRTASLEGAFIGNYRVVRQLGAGAMGEVYLGEHPEIGREVAIKVLVPRLSVDPVMSDRFVSEARAVNRIKHPNIIQIFDFARLPDNRLYYTMELLEGHELTAILSARAPLPVMEVEHLLKQICSALDSAHDAGIVHRDLKPDNIFVCDTPTGALVKILDFGIAKLMDPDAQDQHNTATGVVMGTPLYMAPEQAAGKVHEISTRTDVYALGVIAYQMLSGRLPLTAPTTAELLVAHIAELHTPLAQVVTGLDPALCAVVDRALAKAPAERQASAGELFEQFRQAREGTPFEVAQTEIAATGIQPTLAEPTGRQTALVSAPDAPAVQPTTLRGAAAEVVSGGVPLPAPEEKRSRTPWPLILGAVLAVAAVPIYLLTRSSPTDDDDGRPKAAGNRTAGPVVTENGPDAGAAHRPLPTPTGFHLLRVESSHSAVKLEVRLGDRSWVVSNLPTTVQVPAGQSITLVARRKGQPSQTRNLTPTGDRTVKLTWASSATMRSVSSRPMAMQPVSPRPLAMQPRIVPPRRVPPRRPPRRRVMRRVMDTIPDNPF